MDNLSFIKLNLNNLIKYGLQNHFYLHSLCLLSDYYAEYYKEKFMDLSFLVIQKDKLVGYILCAALEKKISYPNEGVVINLSTVDIQKTKLFVKIIDYLDVLTKQHGCNEISINDYLLNNALSDLGKILFNQKYKANLTFEMTIDYKNFSENNYHKNLRKSYQSLINWGKNNLEIKYINKDQGSFDDCEVLKEFHLKIAGRKTRSDESWRLQYKMVEQGFGEIILAYLKNQLVAGSIFSDYSKTSIYFTGVYDRDLFDHGLSHFVLYNGICRSYERKNTSKFSLGYFDTTISDKKWYNIQFFKKGFCQHFVPTIMWNKHY